MRGFSDDAAAGALLRWVLAAASALCVLGVSVGALAQSAGSAAGTVGVNKYDLFAQYTGMASGGNGSPAYLRITRAMARKSLADAQDSGIRYMRVSMSGRTAAPASADRDDDEGPNTRPSGGGKDSLDLWRTNPQAFWHQVDEMMDDLDRHGIQIVPVLMWDSAKFPGMVGESIGDMFRNPQSKSWQLAERWIREFVVRYRDRPTILFYELTNELNNYADLDLTRRCKPKDRDCSEGRRFATADMLAYTQRLSALIRRLDSKHQISSGFTIPRPSAEHLRARPEWAGADWTKDSREEFARNLRDIHAHVDIISIHLYDSPQNARFGSSETVDLLVEAKRVADQAGKPLYVGEFGDKDPAAANDRSYATRMIQKIRELRIPYSTVWVWQFYQRSTYATADNRHTVLSLEPGQTDFLIDRIRSVNGAQPPQALSRARDTTPPRVVLTWPLPCAPMRPAADAHAIASDNSGAVTKVEFLVDDVVVEADRQPPYQASLSSAQLKNGKHRITARAYDRAGNAAEFSSDVIVGGRAEQCTIPAN